MKKNKRPNISLVLGWYFEEIHRGVAQYAKEHDWRLTAAFPNQPANLDYWDGDGIISSLNRATPEYEFVCQTTLPVVELTEQHPELPFTRVTYDNLKTGQLAANYYLNKGFKELAYIGSGRNKQTTEREQGFKETLAKESIDVRSFIFAEHGQTREERWKSAAKFLKSLPARTGILASYEVTGAAINTICDTEGIAIPDDIALLCCGNHELTCDWTPTPMSSIAMPQFEQGYKAAELLDRMLQGENLSSTHLRLPPDRLIERQSTQILAVNDEAVQRAIRFIKDNAVRPIKVDEVAVNSGASRRYLERAFKKHLGKTINQRIIQQRIEAVKELLQHDNLPTKAIAYELGFSSVQYLHKQFTEQTGMTIREFRG